MNRESAAVMLTLDPELLSVVDRFARDHRISREQACLLLLELGVGHLDEQRSNGEQLSFHDEETRR